jgi:methionyl aminopeptidase
MRVAGRLAAEVLDMIKPHIKPGVSTLELDTICHDYIVNVQNAIPACLGYGAAPGRPAFQHTICTSVNHVVCHGIPSADKILKKGDILNIDVTVIKDGYHGDTNMMYIVGGETSILANRLCHVAQEAMYRGIEAVKPGPILVMWVLSFKNMLNLSVSVLYVNIVDMALAQCFMMNHRYCTTVQKTQACA